MNAAPVFALALRLGISEDDLREGLASFQGIRRRAEKKGEYRGALILDDYAHHPTEIFATLRALKMTKAHQRLIVAFQPHRYSRTKECLDQFAEAFQYADQVILTDIYPAGEKPIEGISSEKVFQTIKKESVAPVEFVKRDALTAHLAQILQPSDLLVTMGAGDITQIGPDLIDENKER